jgi:hypothetical protein
MSLFIGVGPITTSPRVPIMPPFPLSPRDVRRCRPPPMPAGPVPMLHRDACPDRVPFPLHATWTPLASPPPPFLIHEATCRAPVLKAASAQRCAPFFLPFEPTVRAPYCLSSLPTHRSRSQVTGNPSSALEFTKVLPPNPSHGELRLRPPSVQFSVCLLSLPPHRFCRSTLSPPGTTVAPPPLPP